MCRKIGIIHGAGHFKIIHQARLSHRFFAFMHANGRTEIESYGHYSIR